eukprot:TRINITY_DN11773_c0_g3_i3.p1 TRINITY_DN11773_c0_g3~~TRINITY_DN11773_c0_g3_i3.p1  ORF type:complete len:236 (+),score=-6.63 TRINITY_DN11773_c0_g3_i3:449-1156(+)
MIKYQLQTSSLSTKYPAHLLLSQDQNYQTDGHKICKIAALKISIKTKYHNQFHTNKLFNKLICRGVPIISKNFDLRYQSRYFKKKLLILVISNKISLSAVIMILQVTNTGTPLLQETQKEKMLQILDQLISRKNNVFNCVMQCWGERQIPPHNYSCQKRLKTSQNICVMEFQKIFPKRFETANLFERNYRFLKVQKIDAQEYFDFNQSKMFLNESWRFRFQPEMLGQLQSQLPAI